jgi:Bacterial pre-peptidase C-terminal domain
MRHRTPFALVPAFLAFLLVPGLAAAAPPVSLAAPVHQCFPQNLHCGDVVTAALDASECFIDEESYADFYSFAGAAGQMVTITLTSNDFTPSLFVFNPSPALVVDQDASGSTITVTRTLESSGVWRVGATSALPRVTGQYTLSIACSAPPLPAGPFLTSTEFPDFRFKVRITSGARVIAGEKQSDCVPETLCVNGAVAGRSEIFVRLIGPRFNGFIWPEIIKFTTSQVEVWIEQQSTGAVKYYLLPGSNPASTDLPGLFDRMGFRP